MTKSDRQSVRYVTQRIIDNQNTIQEPQNDALLPPKWQKHYEHNTVRLTQIILTLPMVAHK